MFVIIHFKTLYLLSSISSITLRMLNVILIHVSKLIIFQSERVVMNIESVHFYLFTYLFIILIIYYFMLILILFYNFKQASTAHSSVFLLIIQIFEILKYG